MIDETSILIIYTGGTIGMIADDNTGALVPFNFENIDKQIPELRKFNYNLGFHCFEPLLDSSNMNPEVWIELAQIIKKTMKTMMVLLSFMDLILWLILHLP